MSISRAFAALSLIPFGWVHFLAVQRPERIETNPGGSEEVLPLVPLVFEGLVFYPHGAPAAGAVVVSSAGGKASADRSGKYRLEVGLPVDGHRVQITARDRVDGQLVAERTVSLSVGSRLNQVPPLELTQESSCQPDWLSTFGAEPGGVGPARALAVYDDGSGPALYMGGRLGTHAGLIVSGIAKWNGARWSALGGELGLAPFVDVRAMTVFDDGRGPALYAGGLFTTAGGVVANDIARWDGSSWEALDVGVSGGPPGLFPLVFAMTVFDDGSGPALYVGGEFDTAGGVAASGIAKWDGSSWSPLASGVGGPSSRVQSLTVFDDGNGPALYAGGSFTTAGGLPASSIAKWDGASWSPLGSGLHESGGGNADAYALTAFDDGSGPALFAGGYFDTAGGVPASGLARWDGNSWSAVGGGFSGLSSTVLSLTVFDDGSGPALFAGGRFDTAGGAPANSIAKWDGSSWAPLAAGVTGTGYRTVEALAAFDDGRGAALFAGGDIGIAGGILARKVARWDGSSWENLASGLLPWVNDLAVFDDGSGSALFAAGTFGVAGEVVANRIARWDGSGWSPLGSGLGSPVNDDEVRALAAFDDGGGAALHAGGDFLTAGGVAARKVAKWDGSSWSALGSGVGTAIEDDAVNALAVFDDGNGPALYAGGDFDAAGGVAARRIAKWNGASWSGLGGNTNGVVHALAVLDDGGGPALYAGGTFTVAGGVAANRIARWDGSSWSALGSGLDGPVFALAAFDDGGGPALYAGGIFTSAGGATANNVARWDGASWSSLETGLGGTSARVFALTVFDDGIRPALFAGGSFTTAGGVAANHVARWDGSSWSPLGAGMETIYGGLLPEVKALAVFNDRTGLALHAGGFFTQAGDSGDSNLGKWGCPDTTAPVIACPPPIVVDDRLDDRPGEVLSFLVTVADEEDPIPGLVCSPPSGSRFPRGTTLVTCTATDFSGNATTCQFPVTVGVQVPKVR